MPEMELEADPGSLGERGALELMHGVLRALASAASLDDMLHVIVGHGAQVFQPVGAVIGRQSGGGMHHALESAGMHVEHGRRLVAVEQRLNPRSPWFRQIAF